MHREGDLYHEERDGRILKDLVCDSPSQFLLYGFFFGFVLFFFFCFFIKEKLPCGCCLCYSLVSHGHIALIHQTTQGYKSESGYVYYSTLISKVEVSDDMP